MFNLDNYKNTRFSEDDLLDFRIKTVFLLFDKTVDELGITGTETVSLIDSWIAKLIVHEEYEIAAAFRNRKVKVRSLTRWKSRRVGFMVRLRLLRRKVKRFFFHR